MKFRIQSLIVLCFLLSGFSFIQSEAIATGPDAKRLAEILKSSADAATTIPYHGVLTYNRSSGESIWGANFEILRTSAEQKKVTILGPDPFSGTVIVQNEEGTWITPIDEDRKRQVREGNQTLVWNFFFGERSSMGFEDTQLLLKNYDVALKGEKTIAGRKAKCISVQPKNQRRPAVFICVDNETNMQLKYARTNYRGEPYESFEFTQIQFGESVPKENIGVEGFVSLQRNRNGDEARENVNLNFNPLIVKRLPEGFVLKSNTVFKGWRDHIVQHSLYTDGLASLSLFQRKMSEEDRKKREEEMKAKKDDKPLVQEVQRGGRTLFIYGLNDIFIFGTGDLPKREIIRTLVEVECPTNKNEGNKKDK